MPDSLYQSALTSLHTTISQTATAIQTSAQSRTNTVSETTEYLRRVNLHTLITTDYTLPTTPLLLHITGTKGKGSTASFAESILRHSHTLTTGLFTSPHLVCVRERIKINGRAVSEEVFGRCYWEVRTLLAKHENPDDLPTYPGYFRYLTVLALYIFNAEKVAAIILEVGMGGRYDATNVFPQPTVAGVCLLDLDHCRVLGDTMEEIAWEKGGIFKTGVPSLSVEQGREGASIVLRECAQAVGEKLEVTFPTSPNSILLDSPPLGLKGSFQYTNAALALALVNHATRHLPPPPRIKLREGLELTTYPGRCQQVSRPPINFCFDGAHTEVSTEVCLEWFKEVAGVGRAALVFNCSHERNPLQMLKILQQHPWSCVFFTSAPTARPSAIPRPSAAELLGGDGNGGAEESWQHTLAKVWSDSCKAGATATATATAPVHVLDGVEGIEDHIKGSRIDCVLVTGSLYVVGGVLEEIGWAE